MNTPGVDFPYPAYLNNIVYVDVLGRDIGSYVREAKKMVSDAVSLPPELGGNWLFLD